MKQTFKEVQEQFPDVVKYEGSGNGSITQFALLNTLFGDGKTQCILCDIKLTTKGWKYEVWHSEEAAKLIDKDLPTQPFKGTSTHWRVERNDNDEPAVVDTSVSGWALGTTYVVEEFSQDGYWWADAHLVAAAPDLLQAGQHVYRLLLENGLAATFEGTQMMKALKKALEFDEVDTSDEDETDMSDDDDQDDDDTED